MTQPPLSGHTSLAELNQNRSALRRYLLDCRRQLDAAVRQQWDAQIADHLMAWCRQEKPASLAVYWPIQAEPDLRSCYAAIAGMGIQLALPWVSAKEAPLRFLAWCEGDAMLTDDYGIPLPAQRNHLVTPAALLIPCVGFNTARYRLGYGGGYYDRTLPGLPDAVSLGIAYQCACADFAPGEHDIPMTQIMTETGCLA